MTEKVNLADKLRLFKEHWQPKIVSRMNDYDIRIVKVKGTEWAPPRRGSQTHSAAGLPRRRGG